MNGVPSKYSQCASYSGSLLLYFRAHGFGGRDGGQSGRLVNRLADADIGAAAAEIAVHGGVDIRVGGFGSFGEQGRGGHDLSGLAIAALRDVDLLPRKLY